MPGNSHQIKPLELSQYFFNPRVIESDAIFDGLLRGLSTQNSQKMDVSLIPEVSIYFVLLFFLLIPFICYVSYFLRLTFYR